MPVSKDKYLRADGTPRKPPRPRPERLVFAYGPEAARRMRLGPGQRPSAVVATLEEVADAKRLSPRSRGAVTAADFAALKRRWRCRTYASRDAYLAHPAIRMDMRAWALSELSHIPLPGMDTGAGLAATQLADALEAWLNARRWPVEIGRKRMPAILREMGFGVRNGRWNCAWRTLPAKS